MATGPSPATHVVPRRRAGVTYQTALGRDLSASRTSDGSRDGPEQVTEYNTGEGQQNSTRTTHDDDQHTQSSAEERASAGPIFEAIEPPSSHISLDFRPTMLQPQVTIMVCCLYVLLAVGVSCLAILPNGKLAYAIESDTYYFAIRYGPGLVASVSTFLLKNTTQEFLLDIMPFWRSTCWL
jgi:hypothetical protein